MACVISISSDEEDFEDENRSVKRIKLDCPDEDNNNGVRNNSIIVLDDDEDDTKEKVTNKTNTERQDNLKKPNSEAVLQTKNCVQVKYTNTNKSHVRVPMTEKNDITELNTSADVRAGVEKTQTLDITKEGISENAKKCEIQKSETIDDTQSTTENIKDNSENLGVPQTNQNTNEEDSGTNTFKAIDDFKNCKQMQELIEVCLAQIESSETRSLFKSKIPICQALFNQVADEYTKSDMFIKELEEKIILSKKSPYMAVQCFNDIYKLLKGQKKYASAGTSNASTKHSKIIKKLEHTLNKLRKRIRQLELEEINFDEEEDSCYIKLFRYRERAVKVFEKLCKYRSEDPHYDSIMHNRLDFSGSRLPEFNKAINKKFKNNMVFPTYYDVELCLKKSVDSNNIQLSESEFKAEARHCFEKLGNLIQYRRKMNLLEVHSCYVPSNQDPATEDSDLNSKLQSHYKNAKTKTDEICAKYVQLQETGENPNLSTDSDDSNFQQSDDETES